MVYTYNTKGTCAKQIRVEVENGIVKDVEFVGGCSGNTQGIANLVRGMKIEDVIRNLTTSFDFRYCVKRNFGNDEDVIRKCKNIDCGGRGTSCPDQLACALEELS